MVVVGTTGLVNADTTTTVTGNNTETLQSNVTVSGSVTTNEGVAPEGKITVELPTKMAFAVDKVGNLKGGTYTVKNSSKDNIDVYVSEFKMVKGNINLLDNVNPTTNHRGEVALKLTGSETPVNLKSIADGNVDVPGTGTKVSTIAGGASGSIILSGEAGKANETEVDQKGASAEFNMVFKVKKA
jgi:hypothetical protein